MVAQPMAHTRPGKNNQNQIIYFQYVATI